MSVAKEEKSTRSPDTVGMPHPLNSNGNRHTSHTNVNKNAMPKPCTAVPKSSSKGLDYKKATDLQNDRKAVDLNHHDDQKDSVLLQNGIAHCAVIINGYSSKDTDGSGSEGGYSTPKKRKARCNNMKNTEQSDAAPEPSAFHVEATEKGGTSRFARKAETQSTPRRVVASEASVGEPQRKNSDAKAGGKKTEERHKAKASLPSKEDSWTLFKPPPVFPVDNSSAKIVPKISYASKVKENLNKVAQSGAETLPFPVRPSQVPMSAMKTITSASFTNGPVSASGNGCLSVGTFFAPAAGSVPAAASGENVASPLESNCSSTSSPTSQGDAHELRKCSLFIYPLNMQPMLPSARHLNPPTAQTNQKSLGEIFQNQWGLSFINEPNMWPEAVSRPVPTEDNTTVVRPPRECRAAEANAGQPCFFLEPGAEKRTCSPCNMFTARSPPPPPSVSGEEEENTLQPCDTQKTVDAKSSGSAVCAPCKDNGAKPAQGQITTVVFGSSKDVGRRRSWGSFDVKAAVTYHTKEMEYIFSLQKQHPNRVVVYDETMDGPDQ
ncbi:FMR1-interacting protein NUFIP2 isoform X2 [Dunckerocampus dactyliophorus]|nr:FMR1-interacting protein NUFIP2 isoform X2 [Dunckerocampus dactyliophorus]XP_054610350.1 FMR1-interacting protein NUFIP2 isoform X2 [Dunckerocampus dactyliophorus]XP_054610351.1 FMR1-interacting protein NUFIP2 isoform X2 [Dunckerocampus dactyliophorus]